ncbi:septal ring lytic transglycosylase RlpA family protein [Comamonas sp. NLF-1-9]|uniref:septal ring lytic transglycosylase RlpA family protein n=1 Tax=Comamonas sp. NLF-1-9 TaxID=2853163 RepID=UPI001C437ABB|nr:septal ring lytic transglycosylase RlpA family protein [Comamonas sp. NLF-1-9]QXL84448.1 septal ring lytic transglycosylase RlpA family protein [Comamonas sp. NLF-1-9]
MPGGRGLRRAAGMAWPLALLMACAAPPRQEPGLPPPQQTAPSGQAAQTPPALTAPPASDSAARETAPPRTAGAPAPPAVPDAWSLLPTPEPPEPPEPDADEAPDALLLDQGLASWYGPGLNGRRTASGERFDRLDFTAAHRTLPFGTRVCVRSLADGKAVLVRINDRGPFSGNGERVVDLSQAAARELGMTGLGIKAVQLWQVDEDGSGCVPALGAAPAPPPAGR